MEANDYVAVLTSHYKLGAYMSEGLCPGSCEPPKGAYIARTVGDDRITVADCHVCGRNVDVHSVLAG